MAAVLGGTQSLHTNGYDEALALPTEEAARIALRTQQIIAYESGVAQTVDPFAGSYFVEASTNRIEQQAEDYFQKIEALGGMLRAIERGWVQQEIQNAAYDYQRRVESGNAVVVGVNKFQRENEPRPHPAHRSRVRTTPGRTPASPARQPQPDKMAAGNRRCKRKCPQRWQFNALDSEGCGE